MKLYNLENDFVKISLLDVGASVYSFHVKPRAKRNIVLSTKDLSVYKDPPANAYLGATVGRVGGRIDHGKFIIDGKKYQAAQNEKVTNSLHGGFEGFSYKTFDVVKETKDALTFRYISKDGEGGYPGTVELFVKYTLLKNGLKLEYEARTTQKTLLNIINHSYFNLDGKGTILDHTLAANVTETYALDDKQIYLYPVPIKDGDSFDIRQPKPLAKIIFAPDVNIPPMAGIDNVIVVPDGKLTLTTKDLRLKVTSNYPAIQIYSMNYPIEPLLLDGSKVVKYHGFAIEPTDLVVSKNGVYKNLELDPKDVYKRSVKYEIELLQSVTLIHECHHYYHFQRKKDYSQ